MRLNSFVESKIFLIKNNEEVNKISHIGATNTKASSGKAAVYKVSAYVLVNLQYHARIDTGSIRGGKDGKEERIHRHA